MSLLNDLREKFLSKYVLTNQGRVGKVIKENSELHNLSISFGSFQDNKWREKKRVTISKNNVIRYIKKEEVIQKLNEMYSS